MKLTATEYFISKKMGKAIFDYRMITAKDNVLIGVSGGKDSLTLLRLLSRWRDAAPISFSILPIHVDMGPDPSGPPYETEKIINYLKLEGYEYILEKAPVPANPSPRKSICFWCAWRRREALFNAAGRLGFNKIALAHHLDDIVETTLLNMFFTGEISTMSPDREMFGGKIHIIRPFAYVKEKELKRLAGKSNYPELSGCPHALHSKRAYIKDLIKKLEHECSYVKINIFRSMGRIKKGYLID